MTFYLSLFHFYYNQFFTLNFIRHCLLHLLNVCCSSCKNAVIFINYLTYDLCIICGHVHVVNYFPGSKSFMYITHIIREVTDPCGTLMLMLPQDHILTYCLNFLFLSLTAVVAPFISPMFCTSCASLS